MVQKEWAMVERVHVTNDEDFSFKYKDFNTFPKLWPPIISKNKLHGIVKSKVDCN
jgi:hypothetical protein